MSIDHNRFIDVLKNLSENQPNTSSFHRLIGVENQDEQVYFEHIYQFIDVLKEKKKGYCFLQEGFNSRIPITYTQKMNQYWTTVTKLKEPASQTIVNITFGYRNTPLINPTIDALISNALAQTLNAFRENQQNIDVLKNFYFSLTYLAEEILPTILSKEDVSINEKIYIYWGDIKRNEAYFLLFLSQLGIQTIYLNSFSEDGTAKVNGIKDRSTLYEWSGKKQFNAIPTRVKRAKTVAAKAQKEIHDILHTDTNGIFKPWQFEEYGTKTIPLQTTLDELFILWNEPAKYREGFEVKERVVHIPNIFAKISGVPDELDKFWNEYHQLQQAEQIICYDKFPLSSSNAYHNQMIVLKNGQFAEEDVKKMREYDFHHLRSSIQIDIIQVINELIQETELFCSKPIERNFPYIILHTILKMDTQLVKMLQTFDYADQIPKIVVFDGEKSTFTIHDAVLLSFLHKIGFDVVVITPTGYQNMERFIDARFFDHHKRQKFAFDINMKHYQEQNKSWFSKWFKK